LVVVERGRRHRNHAADHGRPRLVLCVGLWSHVRRGNRRRTGSVRRGSAPAALTGLLFVPMSVTPRAASGRPRSVIHQVRSAAALLSFTNALGISLFGLVPNNNAGYPAGAFGIIGTLFTLASVRSILADTRARTRFLAQISLIAGLLAV